MRVENKSLYNNLHIAKDDATLTKNQQSFTEIPKNDPSSACSTFLTTHTIKTYRVAIYPNLQYLCIEQLKVNK